MPAMAGLAIVFQELLPDDNYVAGLWLQDLLRGLLWAYHYRYNPWFTEIVRPGVLGLTSLRTITNGAL